jgi:hypothetical protein
MIANIQSDVLDSNVSFRLETLSHDKQCVLPLKPETHLQKVWREMVVCHPGITEVESPSIQPAVQKVQVAANPADTSSKRCQLSSTFCSIQNQYRINFY